MVYVFDNLRNPDHGRPVNPLKIPLKRYSFTYLKGEIMSKNRPKPAARFLVNLFDILDTIVTLWGMKTTQCFIIVWV